MLAAYDTIIVDEAHERSLNIDFLLGYLKQLLARRPDLKVDRHVGHARRRSLRAPLRHAVTSRRRSSKSRAARIPVEIRYRPPAASVRGRGGRGARGRRRGGARGGDRQRRRGPLARADPATSWCSCRASARSAKRATCCARASRAGPMRRDVEILPLFARLSVAEQQRVFAPSAGRRIVLATNVAETSLTVPGIRYVIDAGLARVKRYSVRNKTTLLQIEKISQAAAKQRAGRCGRARRTASACACTREDDFARRPRYTDPEILRSSLASVILRMASLDLGAVDAVSVPRAAAAARDRRRLPALQELGAVDAERALTPLGRELARLPLDPRIGRMVLAARDRGCLRRGAGHRERARRCPIRASVRSSEQQAADQAHLRFRDDRSDFLSLVALWEFFADARRRSSRIARLVDACRAQFVSFLRLRRMARRASPARGDARGSGLDLDAGIAQGVRRGALRDAAQGGARRIARQRRRQGGRRGALPGRARPTLLPAPRLRTRAQGREVGPGRGAHRDDAALCALRRESRARVDRGGRRRSRERATTSSRTGKSERGEVVASERVQLYGLTLVARRPRLVRRDRSRRSARSLHPRSARDRRACARAAPSSPHNRALVAEVAELEHKARRQDVLVDDETIAAFYAERVPAGVHSRGDVRALARRRRAQRSAPAAS